MISALLNLVTLAFLSAAPPQSTDLDAVPQAPPSNTAVLRLDGEEISSDEYAHWLLENFGARSPKIFAGDFLIEREAQRRAIRVAPEEVESALNMEIATRIQGAFLGEKQGWLAELERTQRSERGLRAQRTQALEIDLLCKKLVADGRVVPEHKIEREWELSYGRGGRAYDLSMLLVRCEFLTPPEGTGDAEKKRLREQEIESKRLRAIALRTSIVEAGDFASVARKHSDDDASRSNGGKLRAGFRHYGWPWSFLDALDNLAVAELSAPIYAKGGWWILRVDGVQLTPLEEVRASLLQRLIERGPEQDETGNYRNALVDSARIEVLPTIFGETPAGIERADLVPALSIDGENISRSSYAMWLLRTRGEASWPHFVEHRVVFNEARRRGIKVSEAEVLARTQNYIRRLILQDHQGSRESWVTQLQMRGNEEALFVHDLQVRMRVELLCERMILLDRVITPEQVRLRFDEVYGEDGTAVKARLILINVALERGPADETREQLEQRITRAKQATRERVQALAHSVRDGGDFATLARQHSEEPSTKAQGGMLDSRFRPDRWPQLIADAVAALEVGGVTEAFEFGSAFVLLQVVARDKADFAAVEKDMLEQMQLEPPPVTDLSLFRNSLFQRAEVEVLDAMNPASK